MGAAGKFLRKAEDGRMMFWCPGCDGAHAINVGDGPSPRWQWNKSEDYPSFSPSVLVYGSEMTAKVFQDDGRHWNSGSSCDTDAPPDGLRAAVHVVVVDISEARN
jgi:hypothetical protein